MASSALVARSCERPSLHAARSAALDLLDGICRALAAEADEMAAAGDEAGAERIVYLIVDCLDAMDDLAGTRA